MHSARRRCASGLASLACGLLTCGAEASDELYERLYQDAAAARLEGSAQTTAGRIPPGSLGFTLMHEHLFVDFLAGFAWPSEASGTDPGVFLRMQQAGWTIPRTDGEREFFNRRELTFEMLDPMRRGSRSRANMQIDDEREVAAEVASFRGAGGHTIVDVTPVGLGRDVRRLQDFAARNGIRVVVGTGWYRWPFHPPGLASFTVEQLTERLVRDVTTGIDGTGIRAGIVGEIPLDGRSMRIEPARAGAVRNDDITAHVRAAEERLSTLPVDARDRVPLERIYAVEELRVLRAAARASRLTGAALSLHAREPWLGYLPVILQEGVPASRIIIGHAHSHFIERPLLERALRAGVVLEADYQLQFYATTGALGPLEEILDGIAWAIKSGHRDQVLLSLDLCYKLGQQRYGGGGYATLHNHVFPRLRSRGVSEDDIRHVMVENPKRLLTFVAPQRRVGKPPG